MHSIPGMRITPCRRIFLLDFYWPTRQPNNWHKPRLTVNHKLATGIWRRHFYSFFDWRVVLKRLSCVFDELSSNSKQYDQGKPNYFLSEIFKHAFIYRFVEEFAVDTPYLPQSKCPDFPRVMITLSFKKFNVVYIPTSKLNIVFLFFCGAHLASDCSSC